MDKVNTFYYNQTFWSSENMCFGKGKKGDLSGGPETHSPLYTCLFTLPPCHQYITHF